MKRKRIGTGIRNFNIKGEEFSMLSDSFAVFSNQKTEMDLHINVWTDLKKINYIDFGIRVHSPLRGCVISVYTPYLLQKKNIQDLSGHFVEETLARGMFNKFCKIQTTTGNDDVDISFSEDSIESTETTTIVSLNKRIEVSNISNGSQIDVLLDIPETSKKGYIIMRIPYVSLQKHVQNHKFRYIDSIESPIMKERYDFNLRINEARTLPKEVIEKISKSHFPVQRFFINVPATIDVAVEGLHKERMIEKNIFKDYFPSKIFLKPAISYQWTKHNEAKATCFTHFHMKKINWISVTAYLVVILLLNLLSNFVYNIIF